MDFEGTAPRPETIRPLFAELVPALTDLEADMRLRITFGTALLPRLPYRLLLFHWYLCGSARSKTNKPRFIGLLNCALGMNAAQRIRRLPADGANVFRRRR